MFISLRIWRKAVCIGIFEWGTGIRTKRTWKPWLLWDDEKEWGQRESDGGSWQDKGQGCV